MKYLRILLVSLFFMPMAVHAVDDFAVAAQLLAAAKNADIQQVQLLINNGADINYVDKTGLSVVCTALMNNDLRAAQILQMYGADASKCDQQIKKYNNNTKPKSNTGGLFGGLSSAQSIALTAAGAAVVVGGLLLLTDVFDPGNNNDNPTGGGDRPGGDGGGGTNPSATVRSTLPYGPNMPNATAEAENYDSELNLYSPSEDNNFARNFKLMNQGTSENPSQNYLLMMHGYSPLARGYLGMRTLRSPDSHAPISDKSTWGSLGPDSVMGGRPVNVALITGNGVNAATNSSLGDMLMPWTTLNNGKPSGGSNDMVSSKYYNNKIIRGPDDVSLQDDSTIEDPDRIGIFDLTGHGTAIHNGTATAVDNMIGKILGGKSSGEYTADFMGFMPNGQMTIFRAGNGAGLVGVNPDEAQTGTYSMAGPTLATGDTLTLYGMTLKITRTGDTIVATQENPPTGTDPLVYNGYIGANGLLYMASAAGTTNVTQAFKMADGTLTQTLKTGAIDYMNYRALRNARDLWSIGDQVGGLSRPNILANASVISGLRAPDAATIDTILSGGSKNYQANFINLVNQYYQNPDSPRPTDYVSPGNDAQAFFGATWVGETSPLVIFSTGAFETNSSFGGTTQEATFENAAPLVFGNKLSHLFMSVVAVGLGSPGTNNASSVSGFAPQSKISLTQWVDQNGTPDDPSDDKYYKARKCGVAGRGSSGIDPWCFAAAGITDEMAVSSMAGAAGALKSAFDYMTSDQLFVLMALTADGPYLATTTAGKAMTRDELKAHLESMYELPNEYQYRVDNGTMDYMDAFREVFGYGLINLERATKPNTKVYFFDGNNIVSASGDAYWRAAANTTFRASSAFAPRSASISAPFFDLLESTTGDLHMPRIWENKFTIGSGDARGLYMGDVLGELRVRGTDDRTVHTSLGANMEFSMGISDRRGNDNLNGLDTLRFDFTSGAMNLSAGFQRHFTDGAARFDDRANPVLSLASNVVTSDAAYHRGRWTFGARTFSGTVTDEALLENDPTVTANFEPARLGSVHGAGGGAQWDGDHLTLGITGGVMRETNTVLGAQTGGLLDLGHGDTIYVNADARYHFGDDASVYARSTYARTTADAQGDFIMGIDTIDSDSFAIGADWGPVSVTVARPLAVTRGRMQYAHAEYEVVKNEDNNYDLKIVDTHVADIDLRPRDREWRISATYRQKLGQWTDGALGMIYRINPNNTDEFGNESIFMFKISHRVGI